MNLPIEITIDQLKNYLGTGLKCETVYKTIEKVVLKNKVFELNGVLKGNDLYPYFTDDKKFCNQFGCIGKYFHSHEFRPICYRLSDLDKFIPELGFVPLDEIRNLGKGHCDYLTKERQLIINKWGFDYWIGGIPFLLLQKLLQWNFWPFGEEYFDQGLVIDKLTLGKKVSNEKPTS